MTITKRDLQAALDAAAARVKTWSAEKQRTMQAEVERSK